MWWNMDGADSCDCSTLREFSVEIWSISSPLIFCYALLLFFGIGNVIRFIKVNSMSKNLALMYIFSLLSNLCWILCFSMVTLQNEYQYPPYATAVYSKILVGIAYQSSIYDLKYIVGFYFKTNSTNKHQSQIQDEEDAFQKRRLRAERLMAIWFIAILVYYVADISVNYIWYYFIYSGEIGQSTSASGHT